MGEAIGLVLANFTVVCLVLSVICGQVAYLRMPGPKGRTQWAERQLAYYLLFPIGLAYLYNGVMHTAFAEESAKFIGWASSPFQYEIGYASFGYAVCGFMAFRASYGFRAATVIAPSLFLLGAAAGHIVQIVNERNFAPGNAGSILWTDIIFPIMGFALLWMARPSAAHQNDIE